MNDNQKNRIEGAAKELGGAVKKGVGKLIGNEQMQAEGYVKETEGKGQQAVAKAGERVKGTVEKVAGAVKETVGKAIGNEQMQVEGAAKKAVGHVRQTTNR